MLVQRYQGMVFRLCFKMTGDRTAAEDLAQEALFKAFSSLSMFREQSSFSTWLFQIAVRKCLDWRRAQSQALRHRSFAPVDEREPIDWDTPETVLLNKEKDIALRRVIEELHEPYRTVVQLYYVRRCSYQEIAEHTQVPVKTVESQLYRARRIMRERGGEFV